MAQRGAELLVGTVTSRNSRALGTLNGLADAVAGERHVSLEVYWLGDEPKAGPARELVQEYAGEAATLLRSGHARAAVVTAWSALEGALPYYAADSRAPLPAGERYTPGRHGRCCPSCTASAASAMPTTSASGSCGGSGTRLRT